MCSKIPLVLRLGLVILSNLPPDHKRPTLFIQEGIYNIGTIEITT